MRPQPRLQTFAPGGFDVTEIIVDRQPDARTPTATKAHTTSARMIVETCFMNFGSLSAISETPEFFYLPLL